MYANTVWFMCIWQANLSRQHTLNYSTFLCKLNRASLLTMSDSDFYGDLPEIHLINNNTQARQAKGFRELNYAPLNSPSSRGSTTSKNEGFGFFLSLEILLKFEWELTLLILTLSLHRKGVEQLEFNFEGKFRFGRALWKDATKADAFWRGWGKEEKRKLPPTTSARSWSNRYLIINQITLNVVIKRL